ncbi:hypothetical protein GIB67_029637 [Kingdonia uniflora]|uniref:Uncharacterized protein n=1 Tax=Kingdonia uniflora TaxID=39325 RepID=A0A7J7LLQ2_9MAGN|nr:hypothetical protein GIB67_029637 [Kingdonia uniflora]
MAPRRRMEASKIELRFGDFVVELEEFPGLISRPAVWKRISDSNKFGLFGAFESAFVALADIQVFTSEAKCKLLGRSKGKTIKHFTIAAKEACNAFEEAQLNSYCCDEGKNGTALGAIVSSVHGETVQPKPKGRYHFVER